MTSGAAQRGWTSRPRPSCDRGGFNRTNYLYGRAGHPQLFGRGEMALICSSLGRRLPFVGTGVSREPNREAIRGLTGQGQDQLAQRLGAMGKAVFEGLGPRALGDIDGSDDRPRRRSV